MRDSTAPHGDPVLPSDLADLALCNSLKASHELGLASLPQAQANSIRILQRALRNIVCHETLSRVVAHSMYDVLEDIRPRTIVTKSGKPRMLILPASGSEINTPTTVLWYEKGNETPWACDLPRANTDRGLLGANKVETCQELIAYKDRMEGLAQALGLYRARPDVNLHSLYNTQVMREVLQKKFKENLAMHKNWLELFSSESPADLWRLASQQGQRPSEISDQAFEIVMKIANSEVKRAIKSFLREVPNHILEPLWNFQESYVSDFRYAKEGATEQEQIKRTRWFLTFPLYRKLADQDEALSLIDTNQLTEGAIAARCGVSAAHIRRLRGLPFAKLTWFGQLGATEFTRILAGVNINHIPQSNKASQSEIATFISVVAKTVYAARARECGPLAKYAASNLLKNAGGRWAEFDARASTNELKHASDFIKAFSTRTILPALFRLDQPADQFAKAQANAGIQYNIACVPAAQPEGGDVPRTRDDVFSYWQGVSQELLLAALSETWHLGAIIAASKSWHKVVGQSSFENVFSMWPALCPTLTSPKGVQLVPLTTSAELAEEGRAMHHCVGGYAAQCLSGQSHIFSVRTSKGVRLSTLQLVQRDRSISLGQNYAAGNKPAPALAAEAGWWINEQINSGAIEIDWKHLLQQQSLAKANMGIIQMLGFDPHHNQIWNKAFCEFKGMCPKNLQADSAEQFVVSVLRQLTQKGAPMHPIAANLLYSLENDIVEREYRALYA